MGYENFNQANTSDSKQGNLNLCNIFEGCNTLKNDFATYGPGMLESIAKAPVETKIAAGVAGAGLAVAVLASSEVLIAAGTLAALGGAGQVVLGTVLPMVKAPEKNKQQ